MHITLGQQHNVGEKPTVILYTYINRHAGTPKRKRKNRQNSTSSNSNTDEYSTSFSNKDKYNTSLNQDKRTMVMRNLHIQVCRKVNSALLQLIELTTSAQ